MYNNTFHCTKRSIIMTSRRFRRTAEVKRRRKTYKYKRFKAKKVTRRRRREGVGGILVFVKFRFRHFNISQCCIKKPSFPWYTEDAKCPGCVDEGCGSPVDSTPVLILSPHVLCPWERQTVLFGDKQRAGPLKLCGCGGSS